MLSIFHLGCNCSHWQGLFKLMKFYTQRFLTLKKTPHTLLMKSPILCAQTISKTRITTPPSFAVHYLQSSHVQEMLISQHNCYSNVSVVQLVLISNNFPKQPIHLEDTTHLVVNITQTQVSELGKNQFILITSNTLYVESLALIILFYISTLKFI